MSTGRIDIQAVEVFKELCRNIRFSQFRDQVCKGTRGAFGSHGSDPLVKLALAQVFRHFKNGDELLADPWVLSRYLDQRQQGFILLVLRGPEQLSQMAEQSLHLLYKSAVYAMLYYFVFVEISHQENNNKQTWSAPQEEGWYPLFMKRLTQLKVQ